MSLYVKQDTELPLFYQFPDFLIRAPLGQTAKLVYMVLYDRMRLSKKNGWIKDGHIYIVYPVASLAETLGRSLTTIKSALNELDDSNLIVRKPGGFGKANEIYVLIPEEGQFSDCGKKVPVRRAENSTSEGQQTAHAEVRKPATNKVIEKDDMNYNMGVRRAYGRYSNVFLTEEEYSELAITIPNLPGMIEKMSTYLAATGKTYHNYVAALSGWAEGESKSYKAKKYVCNPDESL